jgi:hypothetical protein
VLEVSRSVLFFSNCSRLLLFLCCVGGWWIGDVCSWNSEFVSI